MQIKRVFGGGIVMAAMIVSLVAGITPLGRKFYEHASISQMVQAESCVSYDKSKKTLKLKGNVIKEEVRKYADNEIVQFVVAEEGTVFPEDCSNLFYSYTASSIDLSKADTSGVNNMDRMFACCFELKELNLSGINTDNVESMRGMFGFCRSLTSLDLSSFITSKVTDMGCMFEDCSELSTLDLNRFDTSNVSDFQLMFYGCEKLKAINLTGFNTAKGINMHAMFFRCKELEKLDLSGFDVSQTRDMSGMFWGCVNLKKIVVSSKWNAKNVASNEKMFEGCTSIVGGNGTTFDEIHVDRTYARVDKSGEPGYLTGKESSIWFYETTGTLLLIGNVVKEEVSDFSGNSDVLKVVADPGAIFPEDCQQLFENFSAESMDLSGANTSMVKNMDSMFRFCTKLKELNIRGFNTSNVESMNYMFSRCHNLSSLDLSGFDTSNTKSMCGMFNGCIILKALNIRKFDTSKVINMAQMFSGCSALQTLDLSSFDTAKVTDMFAMFSGCSELKTILVSAGWSVDGLSSEMQSGITGDAYMFLDCFSIMGGNGTIYNQDHVGKDYACVDTTDKKGYLTVKTIGKEEKINSYVTRMYQVCLSREPDAEGLNGWAGQLANGNMNGAQIAEAFVFSQELLAKNLSNGDFVETLYMAMMGRSSDAAGKAGWVSQLENGNMSRSEVTKCFVESTEFADICTDYGIVRGSYDASIAQIEKFVDRLYKLCLERNADQAGLYGWVGNLKNGNMNGAQMANSFFFSDEFKSKNVSNEKYVELLYNTLMGRPADAAGKAGWLSQLQGGHMSRRDVMKSFIESTEFTGICTNYGIVRGSL